MLMRYKRLVGVHVNDNFGLADDDIMVGSVHFWSLLEFLLVLEETGYDGWISLDIVPRRESPVAHERSQHRDAANLPQAAGQVGPRGAAQGAG